MLEIGVDATTQETDFLETVAEATQTLNHHRENTLTFFILYSLILFVNNQAVKARFKLNKQMNDWYCYTCKFKIFGTKAKCKKCGQLRPPPAICKASPSPSAPEPDSIRNIKEQRDAELKLYLSEADEIRESKMKILKAKAIQEGLSPLYYITSCTECKSLNPKPGHNCWKYS